MKPPLQGAPLICQPHTTTTFLRLCSYLIQVRYIPQHWISEVLDTLLSGVISTPFLPVLKSPQPPEEASKNLSGTDLTVLSRNIHPFVPELHTLLSLYHEEFHLNRLICFTPILPLESITLMKAVYWLTLPRYEEDLARHIWGLVADSSQTMANAKNFEASFSSQSNEENERLFPVEISSQQNENSEYRERQVRELYVFNNFFMDVADPRRASGPNGELATLVRVSIWLPLDLKKRFEFLTVVLEKSESLVPLGNNIMNYPNTEEEMESNDNNCDNGDNEDMADRTSKPDL